MHEVDQLNHCLHFHLNPWRVSGSSAGSSSIKQPGPLLSGFTPAEMPASLSGEEATILIAQHFGSILLSLGHMGRVERGLVMAKVPTASIRQSMRDAAPEASMHVSHNHPGYSQQEAPLSHICACK